MGRPAVRPLYAFFHVYTDGDWFEPLDDYLTAVKGSGLDAEMWFGIVGDRTHDGDVIRTVMDCGFDYNFAALEDSGFEQVTLRDMVEHATEGGNHGFYLYSHTKGAWANSQPDTPDETKRLNVAWRRSMFHDLIGGWRRCVELLESGEWDAVGSHRIHAPHGNGYFGGNSWWATADYLRTLPPVSDESRYEAEVWIARNPEGRLFDLRPGWPGFGVFAKEAVA